MTEEITEYSSLKEFHFWPKMPGQLEILVHDMLSQCLEIQWQSHDKIKKGQMQQAQALMEFSQKNIPHYNRILSRLRKKHKSSFLDIWNNIPILTLEKIERYAKKLTATEIPASHGIANPSHLSVPGHGIVPFLETTLSRALQTVWFARIVDDHGWDQMATLVDLGSSERENFKEAPGGWGFATKSAKRLIGDISWRGDEVAPWLTEIAGDFYCRLSVKLLPKLMAAYKAGTINGFKGAIVYVNSRVEMALCEAAKLKGLSIIPVFAQAGVGIIAAPCPENSALHVQSEAILLENIKGRILLTTLHNLAMPLMRVDLTLPVIITKPCSCGRGSDVIEFNR